MQSSPGRAHSLWSGEQSIPAPPAPNTASRRSGSVSPGYLADIVLWDMHKPYWYPRHNKLSLLVYAANANDADTVLVAGKVVLKNGKLTNVDEEKIYAEACACVEDLLNK